MSGARAPVDLGPFGLAIGHATDEAGATGCTVVRGADGPFAAAVAVVGRATGSRELGTLAPTHLVERVDAILLTGGSAFGLDAAAGVVRWLEARGRGFDVGVGAVPIVPVAVLFDLAPLGRPDARPTADMAHAACESAAYSDVPEGSVGAGTGAVVGKALGVAGAMKGGVGLGAADADDRGTPPAAALAAVNAFGDVRDGDGRILAGARGPDGAFADARAVVRAGRGAARFGDASGEEAQPGRNTTLAVVMLRDPLPRLALHQVAAAAAAALHRRITPAGTSFDGDVIFAVSPLPGGDARAAAPDTPRQLRAEVLAVDALERAVERAVRTARGRDGIPGLADAS